MADYVSKYTGSEVDGILDEAIELPQSSQADEGKILTVNSTGEPVWADKINIDTSLKDIEGFSTNKYLRAVGGTAVPEWTDWDIPDYSGVGQGSILTVESCWNGENKLVWNDTYTTANDGQYLKYSSNTGIVWDNPLDTSEASEGQFLKYTGDTHDLEWGDPIDTSNANSGDFLKYGSNGLEWDNPLATNYADNGKYLKYSSDYGIIWDNPINTSDASDGDFLKYSSSDGIVWDSAPGALPEYNGDETVLLAMASGTPHWYTLGEINIIPHYNSSYAGKVLTVLDNGALGWVLPNQ